MLESITGVDTANAANAANPKYQYTTFQNTDYKVYLTPNEFYT